MTNVTVVYYDYRKFNTKGFILPNRCKTERIKKQNYYVLKFSLSQFVRFMSIQTLKNSQRKKLILYFKTLQKADPIVKEFSNGAFLSIFENLFV